MREIDDNVMVKVAIGLMVTIIGIILGWLWLVQQQLMAQQVADASAVGLISVLEKDSLGKISVLENRIMALKDVGSTSAQQAIIDVHKADQELKELNNRVATKDDILRIEKRLDRIETKCK